MIIVSFAQLYQGVNTKSFHVLFEDFTIFTRTFLVICPYSISYYVPPTIFVRFPSVTVVVDNIFGKLVSRCVRARHYCNKIFFLLPKAALLLFFLLRGFLGVFPGIALRLRLT